MSARRIYVIATTEFGTAVRTKSFFVGILMLPIIMGASIVLQKLAADQVDTRPRRFAVLDRSGMIEPVLAGAAEAHNAGVVGEDGEATAPRFVPVPADLPEGVDGDKALLALSDRVRDGDLDAFVEVPAGLDRPEAGAEVRFYSDSPNDSALRDWLTVVVNDAARSARFREAGIDRAVADRLGSPVPVDNLGLLDRGVPTAGVTADGEAIKGAERVDPIRVFVVPAVLLFLTFFVVMASAPQLLNSVLEEKMSRISEVLLGSASPFELMMGKLIGNVGIALLLSVLYVGGAAGLAAYFGYADALSVGPVLALVVFMPMAVLLYGSLYMAVGAACSELKDAQSLMMPVMLLSMLPVFVWTAVLQNPSSSLAVGMSLFPPATPYLMLMRTAMHPAPPAWQIGLSIVLTALTALACVWAAGKIFRTGLLMHGKPPSFAELARWVVS